MCTIILSSSQPSTYSVRHTMRFALNIIFLWFINRDEHNFQLFNSLESSINGLCHLPIFSSLGFFSLFVLAAGHFLHTFPWPLSAVVFWFNFWLLFISKCYDGYGRWFYSITLHLFGWRWEFDRSQWLFGCVLPKIQSFSARTLYISNHWKRRRIERREERKRATEHSLCASASMSSWVLSQLRWLNKQKHCPKWSNHQISSWTLFGTLIFLVQSVIFRHRIGFSSWQKMWNQKWFINENEKIWVFELVWTHNSFVGIFWGFC